MKTFLRLLGFLRPYRRSVGFSALLACAATASSVLLPDLIGRVINAVRIGATAQRLHHHAAHVQQMHVVLMLSVTIAVAVLARWALTFGRRIVAGRVSLGIEYDLRALLYGHLQALELGFFDGQQTGQLTSRATVDLQAVRFFLGYGLVFILQSALTLVLAACAMVILNPLLGLIAMAPVPFVVLIAERYGRSARPAVQEVQQRIAELTAEVEENLSGVRLVKAFAQEQRQLERFREHVGRLFDQSMVATRLEARFNPLIGFLPQLGLTAVLLIGGEQVIGKQLSLGVFSAFLLYVNMLIAPMRTLGVTLGLAQRATASGARIFQLLDRRPMMVQDDGAPPLPPGSGHVLFRKASLHYSAHDELARLNTLEADRTAGRTADREPDRATRGASRRSLEQEARRAAPNGARQAVQALHEIDLDVPAGATIALVGPAGSGKSSLLALLARLYDLDGGSLQIDGADVREVDIRSLRRAVASVGDDPFLFSASVAENIAYARPEATADEIRAAAQAAQADEFIAALPNGYQTRIGERGLTLSGGQRQRLAIARALLARPRILLLDDATSAVDATTERQIREALAELMRDRTTFIVGHRLSTIALADEVVVMEGGRIADRGTHAELLARNDYYRELAERDPRTHESAVEELFSR